MKSRVALPVLLLSVSACASTPKSASEPLHLGAPPPELLLPSGVDDIAFANCVAQQLESDAIRHSNRLARSRAGALSAAMQAAMRDQEASVAYGAAALKSARSRNIASQMPRNEGAQAAANYAQVATAASLGAWRRANAMRVNADRAALAVEDSADVAYRFAQLSRHHATLFEIEADWEAGASPESRRDDHTEALAGLYEVVTPRPDLEFLYVDRFLRTHDAPPDRCTH